MQNESIMCEVQKNKLQREIEHRSEKMRGGWRRLKDIKSIERENQNFQNMSWQFFRPSSCLHASMNLITYWTWQQLWPQARPGVVAGWGAFDFHAMETFAQKQLHADHLLPRVVSCLPSRVAITTVLSLERAFRYLEHPLIFFPQISRSPKSPAYGSCLCFTRTVICVRRKAEKQIIEGLGFRVLERKKTLASSSQDYLLLGFCLDCKLWQLS